MHFPPGSPFDLLIEVPLGEINHQTTIVITGGLKNSHLNTVGVDSDAVIGISNGTTDNTQVTSVKIIKNEIGCRDDTMPKTVETRRHCEVDLEHTTIFRNTQKQRCREGVAEDCCML